MINPLELRLNNIFKEKYSGKIIKVIGLESKRTVFDFQTLEKWQSEPIPLTEDLLLKLGFEKSGIYFHLNNFFIFEWGIFDVTYHNHDIYHHDDKRLNLVEFTSVNHLQNCFYFSTGKELDTSKII